MNEYFFFSFLTVGCSAVLYGNHYKFNTHVKVMF